MQYRKIGADRIFDGCRILTDHHLLLGEDGTVAGLVPSKNAQDVQLYSGTLMPGLINCHCHLELSHLKNVIPPGSGLVPFLINVVQQRSAPDSVKQQNIQEAAAEMERNGIVAVADICNTKDAIAVKKQSSLYWHSLVEVLNFFDANLEQAMENYGSVAAAHAEQQLPAVLTPHAPYSVGTQTLQE